MNQNVHQILKGHYPEGEYALLAEVRNKAGFDASRSCDFLAMGLWPSRGLMIEGLELKSHRSDWLSELKKPAKAEAFFNYCDHWWLLTEGEDVAKLDEIPEPWGWKVIKNSKVIIKKEAPKLDPISMTKTFLAAILKRACDKTDYVHISSINDKLQAAVDRGKESNRRELERTIKDLRDLEKRISEFEKAAGITIDFRWSYEHERVGKAIKSMMNGDAEDQRKKLLNLESTAKKIYDDITNQISALSLREAATPEKQ